MPGDCEALLPSLGRNSYFHTSSSLAYCLAHPPLPLPDAYQPTHLKEKSGLASPKWRKR